jgi:hypothetical protein
VENANTLESMSRRPAEQHSVRVYRDSAELAETVAEYLVAGFESGTPAVLVATPEHRALFMDALAARGWSASRTARRGILFEADAETTLAAIMQGGEAPSPSAFASIVGGLLDEAAKRFPMRVPNAFGEMVDLLTQAGRPGTAMQLEELWNDLGRRRRFSLLCGYRVDLFDRQAQTALLPHICGAHSHVLPTGDPERLARAVDLALDDVLGPIEAGKVYVLVGREAREARVPLAQLVLMWVSANMPVLADRILGSARAHYFGRTASAL